jgi:Protein of unknown function (DUF2891)
LRKTFSLCLIAITVFMGMTRNSSAQDAKQTQAAASLTQAQASHFAGLALKCRRVLSTAEFRLWFHRFLPQLAGGAPKTLLEPATVSDRSDPKLVHLDGLNLSRAWCMRSIARALPPNDPARRMLARAARAHADDALAHVASGDYAGEHWLASFAVYLLSTPEP